MEPEANDQEAVELPSSSWRPKKRQIHDPVTISPEKLTIALEVLKAMHEIDEEHPDYIEMRKATSLMAKAVKKSRRLRKRAKMAKDDRAVISATATGAAERVDDETSHVIPFLQPMIEDKANDTQLKLKVAGTLHKPRPCYICKRLYTVVDGFYHSLCLDCAAMNHAKRHQRTDLTGKRALLTGGRAKIGMYIALRLLRDGAHTTITTRFPKDAIRRFSSQPDSKEWLHCLRIVEIDLRDPFQVIKLADSVAAAGPLDILINNAAQTVRRTPDAYSLLMAAENEPLEDGVHPEIISFKQAHQVGLLSLSATTPINGKELANVDTSSALVDAGGLIPDTCKANSWTKHIEDVDPIEMLEVQLTNTTAPFLLISRLRKSMASSKAARTYVVNVSAMEGVFSRQYKGPGHPHTNMAKAALNMLTRTSASEMYEADRILMTSVDTGWVTDERPMQSKAFEAKKGFHTPLDLEDGAARVYDPIVQGQAGVEFYGVFLKDYKPSDW